MRQGVRRQAAGYVGHEDRHRHLRGAFAEAAVLFLRHNPPGKAYFAQLAQKHGTAQARTVLAHKLARAVYYRLARKHAVDLQRFVTVYPPRGETEPTASLANNGQSLPDAPYIPHELGGIIWTKAPEPPRLIGPSLPLTGWVTRHQGPRGCPSPESDPNWEGLRPQPAGIDWTGRRAQKSFWGVALAGATVSRGTWSTETSTLYRCLVQS